VHRWFREPDGGGQPSVYSRHPKRGEFVARTIADVCPDRNARILDIGCNVGRNSEYIRRLGYVHLHGIEINRHAVEAMSTTYPALASVMKVHNCAVEDIVKELATDSYDCAFTVTVLMHLHPDSEWVFAEIARITRRLVTLENEMANSKARWARDYGAIFTALGAVELGQSDTNLQGQPGPYVLRLFDCEGVR